MCSKSSYFWFVVLFNILLQLSRFSFPPGIWLTKQHLIPMFQCLGEGRGRPTISIIYLCESVVQVFVHCKVRNILKLNQ